MPEKIWNDRLEYLQNRIAYHNDDYLEFLVKKVWCLDVPCKIIDFGCGSGYLGIKLLPLLPDGSHYTGIDKSAVLLEAANNIFSSLHYPYHFIESEVYSIPFDGSSFDLSISHAVLMHIEKPVDALKEMIRVTRNGGLIITCEANRNAWNSLFYIDEINTQEAVPLSLVQQLNKDIREKTGVDYNIGIKMPVLMEKAGLQNQ